MPHFVLCIVKRNHYLKKFRLLWSSLWHQITGPGRKNKDVVACFSEIDQSTEHWVWMSPQFSSSVRASAVTFSISCRVQVETLCSKSHFHVKSSTGCHIPSCTQSAESTKSSHSPLEIIQRENLTLIFKVVRSCSIRWPLIAHLFVRSFWKRVM